MGPILGGMKLDANLIGNFGERSVQKRMNAFFGLEKLT